MIQKLYENAVENIRTRLQGYRALDRREKRSLWGGFLIRNAIYIVIALLVVYVQIYSIQNNYSNAFISPMALNDIMMRAGASLLQKPLSEYSAKMYPDMTAPPIILVLFAVMAVGAAFGAVNGYCVAKFKLHPFIVTLSTALILYGLLLRYVQFGKNGGGPISGLLQSYNTVVKGTVRIAGTQVPYYVFYAIAAALIMWVVWNRTTLGKNMYAVGANAEAANISGISIMKTTVGIFVIAGVLYGIAGFIEAARTGSNSPTTAEGYELDAIAACVIGGVSFTGGTGKISGVVTGVILLQLISVALQWLTVPSHNQYIIKGLIILVSVAIDMNKYHAKK
jgi:methyl-galactoside transport system permease protein